MNTDPEIMTSFPWSSIFIWLGLSLPIAGVVLLIYALLMSATARRSLMGGILEAVVKNYFFRLIWFFALVTGVPGIYLIFQREFTAGILLLIAGAILGAMRIPVVHDLVQDFAVVERLAAHLWNRRHEIEKVQEMMEKSTLSEPTSEEEDKAKEPELSAKDRKLRGEIDTRFQFEQLRAKVLHPRKVRMNDLVEEAAKSAGPGFVDQYTGTALPGTGPGASAAFGEYAAFFLLILAASYIRLAVMHLPTNRVDLGASLWTGALIGIAIMILIPLIRWLQWKRSEWNCIVCTNTTRRVFQRGGLWTHICSEVCEQKLRELYGLQEVNAGTK